MSLVLARRDAGLDLFLVRTRDRMTNQLNGIRIEKMKNKLGTRQLPTAELTLNGTKAILLSQEGRGVVNTYLFPFFLFASISFHFFFLKAQIASM